MVFWPGQAVEREEWAGADPEIFPIPMNFALQEQNFPESPQVVETLR